MKMERKTLDDRQRPLLTRRNEIDAEVNSLKSESAALERSTTKKKREIEELKDENEGDAVEISQFDQEVELAESSKRSCEEKLHQAEQELILLRKRRNELSEAVQAVHANNKSRVDRHQDVETQVKTFAASIKEKVAEKRKLQQLANELARSMESKLEKVATAETSLKSELENSAKLEELYGEPLATTEAPPVLLKRISELKAAIAQAKERYGSSKLIQATYQKTKQNYTEFKAQYGEVQQNLEILRNMCKSRVKRWTDMRAHYANHVDRVFSKTLAKRGFQGSLQMDHDEGKLRMIVRVTANQRESTTKSLSGGEKSYSTLCFLNALWHIMDSPFRVLDEFDVFMDPVVRLVAIKNLLDFCLNDSNRQYIFITPLDLSSIEKNPNISIHSLSGAAN
eukprot:c18592_g1_i2.p1 GENE.c18592_g1_i2~~c18592_g1_i2.p1  ORF type:complete len:397 (+),score=85.95 c18592_g1_i2:28-1218(+)